MRRLGLAQTSLRSQRQGTVFRCASEMRTALTAFSAVDPLNDVRSTHGPASLKITPVLPITASLQLCHYRHV